MKRSEINRLIGESKDFFDLMNPQGCPSLLPVKSHAHELKKPNVIFIFADYMGYRDLACYGHPYAKTPAIGVYL